MQQHIDINAPEELERACEGRVWDDGADGGIVVGTQRQMRVQSLVRNVDLTDVPSLCALSGMERCDMWRWYVVGCEYHRTIALGALVF